MRKNHKQRENSVEGYNIGKAALSRKIRSGEFKIAVYGLGHVGSPLVATWLRAGAHVIGVDKSPRVLENAKKGKINIHEPGVSEAFSQALKEKRFHLYTDPIRASQDSNLKLICVPVLLTNSLSADLLAVRQVTTSIARGLKRGDIVSLNPSVPPGVSEETVIPILEKESGMNVEQDFYMVYNPERIYAGRAVEDLEERYPAIVAGAGSKSLEIGSSIYRLIAKKGVVRMNSIRAAETEKLLEGVYRDVNIALANEMAKFCESVGVDFWEARRAANSQPFSHLHKPGAGVGGACIPVYPQFILHAARKVGVDCKLTSFGRDSNDSMPAYCVRQALKLLGESDIPNCTVSLLGLAFRGGVSDTRLSPTYRVIDELKKLKVKRIRVHDPLVTNDPNLSEDIMLTPNLSEAVKDADLVVLITDHPQYQHLTHKELYNKPVYDGRGILDGSLFAADRFASIGRP